MSGNDYQSNLDLTTVTTPVDAVRLGALLELSSYNWEETEFLVDGFTRGFTIGYQGPVDCADTSRNIPFSLG